MNTRRMRDPEFLRSNHYGDSSRFNARLEFWRRFDDPAKHQWPRWVFDHLEIPENADVLEVGCGTGDLWSANRDRVPEGWRITLTDLSEGMLGEARGNLASVDGAFTYELANVDALPFEDAHWNAVIANHMLYHAPDLDRAISELARVLKPGGKLHAATNTTRHIRELDELHRMFDVKPPHEGSRSGHGNVFSIDTGRAALEAHFESVEVFADESVVEVDDPDPIIAFLLSRGRPLRESALRDHVTGMIEKEGAFRVTRSSGIFLATRSDPEKT